MKAKPMKQKAPVAPVVPAKPAKPCGCKKGGAVGKKKC